MNKLGFDKKVTSFIGKYDEQQQFALAMVGAIKPQTGRLAPINSRALSTLKETDYQFLSAIGPEAVRAVSTGVIRSTIQGRPRSEIIDRVRGKLSLELQNHAVTYADTALTSYDRRVSLEIWQEAGLELFLYRGPRDIKNRPFCNEHVGKVYTLAEIKQMLNGVGPGIESAIQRDCPRPQSIQTSSMRGATSASDAAQTVRLLGSVKE